MIDFLFSVDPTTETGLADALAHSRPGDDQTTAAYVGDWGVLVTRGSAYAGFGAVDTDGYLVLVLGGPLPRDNDSVAAGNAADDGTRWILERWKRQNVIRWDDDLVGHFLVLCIDKQQKTAELVTDINAFVQSYICEHGPMVLGSHADAVAQAAGCVHEVDPVSVADFLTFGTVTYPFTMYGPVKHLAPASITRIDGDGRWTAAAYWEPRETVGFDGIGDAAERLRDILTANVKRMCAGQGTVGLLMSGGEDSRAVASLVPETTRVQAVTITDSFNREARIAERVCTTLGVDWQSVQRSPTHYLDHAADSVRLSESHNFFMHAHVNGFVQSLPRDCRVLGGLAADAFCKGVHIKQRAFLGYAFAACAGSWQFGNGGVDTPRRDAVEERRHKYNDAIRNSRTNSWAEWHSLTPAAMNTDLSFLAINRRLFASYEPFVDAQVVKLSAAVPQDWKLNRRLFHRAMRPVLRRTWRIPHGDGRYPYFGPRANFLLRRPLALTRRIKRRLGIRAANDGPWPLWDEVARDPRFSEICPRYAETLPDESPVAGRDAVLDLLRVCDEQERATPTFRSLHVKLWLASLVQPTAMHV